MMMVDRSEGTTGPTVQDRFSLLRASHRIDWRFLLPNVRLGRVACLGDDDELIASLTAAGASVEVFEAPKLRHPGAPLFDGVVVSASAIGYASFARALLEQGGWLYVELPPKRLMRSPGLSRRYRQRLLQLGFHRVETYWHFPNFRFRRAIVPLFDRSALHAALARRENTLVDRTKAIVAKLLAEVGLLESFVRHVTLLAVLPQVERSKTALAALLAAHRDEFGLDRYGCLSQMSQLLITPPGVNSTCVVALLHPQGQRQPTLVAKLSRLAGDRERLAREATSLAVLHNVWGDARGRAPEVVAVGDLADHPFVLETALSGEPLDPIRVRRDPRRYVDLMTDWLANLAKATAAPMEAGWYQGLVETPLLQFERLVSDDQVSEVVAETLKSLSPLRTRMTFTVFEHGDLAHPNIILTAPERIGAVDWENSNPRGLPAHDLIFFLSYVAFAKGRARGLQERVLAFHDAFIGEDAWAARVLGRFADRVGLDRSLLTPLVLACWSRYTAGIASRLTDTEDTSALGGHDRRPPIPEDGVRSHVEHGWFTALWRHTLEHVDDLAWRN
jgi:aminoglycoside phosphotransferase (APT) family kinase protein